MALPPHPNPPDCFLLGLWGPICQQSSALQTLDWPIVCQLAPPASNLPYRQRWWFRIRSIAVCFPSDANHLFVVRVSVPGTCQETLHPCVLGLWSKSVTVWTMMETSFIELIPRLTGWGHSSWSNTGMTVSKWTEQRNVQFNCSGFNIFTQSKHQLHAVLEDAIFYCDEVETKMWGGEQPIHP